MRCSAACRISQVTGRGRDWEKSELTDRICGRWRGSFTEEFEGCDGKAEEDDGGD